MKTYFTYILECSDGSFYTGITNNLERRLQEHNEGINKGCYTFKRRPVEIKWYNEFRRPMEAIRLEKQIKRWSRKKKIALIEGRNHDLIALSKNYTEYGKPDPNETFSKNSD